MSSHDESQIVVFGATTPVEDALQSLSADLAKLAARIRAWAKLLRERPHDFMAMAVITSIGAYFSFVGYMLALIGPGE